MFPIALGCILAAVALAVWLSSSVTARRGGGARRPVDRQLEQWANIVRHRLPAAFDAQNVAKAGPERRGARPRPRIVGAGKPIPHGWQWSVDWPGSTEAGDWEPNRIAAAINTGGRLAAAAEVNHDGRGWGSLAVFRTEPLDVDSPVPWRPGAQPACCPPGRVCIGRRRDGSHVHFDLLVDGSGVATLIAGRRQSGKSETARLVAAQVGAWGWAPPIVVDLVRHGVDYAQLLPLLDRPIITDPKEAAELVRELNDEADRRAAMLRASGRQKIRRFTPDMPARCVIWEEVQSLNDSKAMKVGFRRWVQQARPVGSIPILITQHALVDNVDSTLRAQIANAWVGRVRNADEARVALGVLPEGQGPHHLRLGPGGFVADVDGPELLTGRTWHITPRWLDAHVKALAGVSV